MAVLNIGKSKLQLAAVVILVLLFICYFMTERIVFAGLEYKDQAFLQLPRVNQNDHGSQLGPGNWNNQRDIAHLAFAICDDRFDYGITSLKSAVLVSKVFLVIHMFIDTEALQEQIKIELDSWPSDVRTRMVYNIYNASFPDDITSDNKTIQWQYLFKPCATQRIFIADLLSGVDSVLYVDADTIFLAPVEELWPVLYEFNSTQFVAVVSVSDRANKGPYHGWIDIPFYGVNGINSGLLLLNLTRIRASPWLVSMTQSIIEYRKKVIFGDQDLINIYLHDHPENGYLLPCVWNFRKRHKCTCDEAERTGVALLHGAGGAFSPDRYPLFRAVYLAFKEFRLGTHDVKRDLLPSIERNMADVKRKTSGDCKDNSHALTKRLYDLF